MTNKREMDSEMIEKTSKRGWPVPVGTLLLLLLVGTPPCVAADEPVVEKPAVRPLTDWNKAPTVLSTKPSCPSVSGLDHSATSKTTAPKVHNERLVTNTSLVSRLK